MNLLEPILAELKAQSSRDAYSASWKRWADAGGPVGIAALSSLTVEQLRGVRTKLTADRYSLATVKRCFIVAKRVWMSLSETENKPDPFVRVKVIVGDNTPHWNVLQKDELKTLSEALRTQPLARAVVLALGLQGWRRHVLCSLRWSDVRKEGDGYVAEFKSKRGGVRTQRIHPEVMRAVEQLGTPVSMEEPFIGGEHRHFLEPTEVYRIVTRACKRVLSKHVTPHGLRATFISTVISQKGNIALAAQLAGHSSTKTTERYLRWQLTGTKEDEVDL